ncbi:MAG: hypothetical protein IJ325_08665 [Clostridia bacterium]|nr:hypothetical protein [Clostridia bacterium]
MLGCIAGSVVGLAQFFLLRIISARITGIQKGRIFPFFLVKLCLYGGLIALALTVFREDVLLTGCGYAVGMGIGMVFAAVSLLCRKGECTASAVQPPSDANEKTEGE